ncbi:hypothetical protein [Rhodoblastus sp.]|jgi:phage host-nuclease inhibitor protein Gam|uniref:hypothetical protein n=1 Tax=Rhodoblastus sp. TaxID=1962975 RepID=UPI0025EC93EC|nr:hypothetical protein [Rhodoblastus sp.]
MCEIIQFQAKRSSYLRRKADKYAEISSHHAARVEWLKRNGAPLADQVRASLDAEKADRDCREIVQTLAELSDEAPHELHS